MQVRVLAHPSPATEEIPLHRNRKLGALRSYYTAGTPFCTGGPAARWGRGAPVGAAYGCGIRTRRLLCCLRAGGRAVFVFPNMIEPAARLLCQRRVAAPTARRSERSESKALSGGTVRGSSRTCNVFLAYGGHETGPAVYRRLPTRPGYAFDRLSPQSESPGRRRKVLHPANAFRQTLLSGQDASDCSPRRPWEPPGGSNAA